MQLKKFIEPFTWGNLIYVLLLWQRCFREEFDVLRRFLYPTDDEAHYYPGEDTPMDRGCRIDYRSDGRIFALDDFGGREELTKTDVISYKFDLNQFRREMCEGFDLIPKTGDIGVWDRIIPWGTWEPERGTAFPVTFILGDFSLQSFREKVLSIAVNREAAGEMIITPDRSEWTGDIPKIAQKGKILLVPLNEVLQMVDDKLRPMPEWNDYMAAFCKMVEMDLPSKYQGNSSVQQYEFRKKGEMWVLRFEGEEAFLKDSVGLQCIGQLLSKPNDPVFATELRAAINGQKPEMAIPLGAREDVVDASTLTEVKKRYLQLQADLDVAQREGNDIMETEVEEEMEKIIHFLSQVQSKGGEVRRVSDELEKARSATSKAFWRSINLIRDDMPQLVVHIEKSFVVGVVCNYAPEKKISWLL